MQQLTVVRWDIVVLDDDAVSNEQDLRGYRLVAIQMPAAWTAADIGFFSRPGLPVGDAGNDTSQLAFVIQAAVSTYRVLTLDEQAMAAGCAWTTLQSLNHASLPNQTTQAGDRSLIGVVAPRE